MISYLITTGEATPENFPEKRIEIIGVVEAAARAGISMVQVREKRLTAKQLFELSRECAAVTSASGTKLLINSRADIAFASGANGVHLPEEGVPISEVRRLFPSPFMIVASVHSIDAVLEAKRKGADLAVFGPVFDTPGKSAKGIDALREVCTALENFPVLAIGGINAENYNEVLAAGASGYAAIRYLNEFVLTNE